MKPPEPYRSRIAARNLERRDRGELWYQRGEPSGEVCLTFDEAVSPEQREAFLVALREAVEAAGGKLRPAETTTEEAR